jgi:hypothetical protein
MMDDWADREAEKIIDAFVAYDGPDDLLRLQQAITLALCQTYEIGRRGRMPEAVIDLQ